MNSPYRIIPKEPLTAQASDVSVSRSSVSFWGPAFVIALLAFPSCIALVGSGTAPESSAWFIWLGALGLACLIYWVRKEGADTTHQEMVEDTIRKINRDRIKQSEAEALQATQQALSIKESVEATISELSEYLRDSEMSLRQAEKEYKDRAFGPFWDEIEMVAADLAEFAQSIDLIKSQAIRYHQILHGRIHNFPPLPSIPVKVNPTPVISEFNRLVRLGQKNFEFATIWEQRRTRSVLIEGFSTLGQAVSSLGETISFSVEDLRGAISSGTDDIVKEQKRMRESFEEAVRKWEDINRKD